MSDFSYPSDESPMNEPQAPDATAPLALPLYESAELFQGSRVVNISHAGETYRLLITRNNRLILQK
jgi:hemin uptake protein HemP